MNSLRIVSSGLTLLAACSYLPALAVAADSAPRAAAPPAAPGATSAAAPRPAAPDSSKGGRGIRYLVLIRHGIYDRDSLADDRVGNALNPLGHEQARVTGARLATLTVRPAALISSDFTRARETADDIGRELGMAATRDTLLRECTPTSDRPDLMRDPLAEIAACDAALSAAYARYVRPSPEADRHDVLVCHGNVIRWFVGRALGMDARRWHAMEIGNGSLTIIAVRPDGAAKLVMFSDVGHLDPPQQTWTGKGAGWSRPATR